METWTQGNNAKPKEEERKKGKKIDIFDRFGINSKISISFCLLFSCDGINLVDLVKILFVCNWRVNKMLYLLKLTFLTSYLVRFNFNERQIFTINLIQLKGSFINDVKKRISLFFTLHYHNHIHIITPTRSRIPPFDIVTSFMNNQFKERFQFYQPCLKHLKIRLCLTDV